MKTENNFQVSSIYVSMSVLLKAELEQGNIQYLEGLKALDSKNFFCYESNYLSLEESVASKESLTSEYVQTHLDRRYNLNSVRFGRGGIRIYYPDGDMISSDSADSVNTGEWEYE